MKTIICLSLLMACLIKGTITAQGSSKPTVGSARQLFYLQRSKDANTVIYEANVSGDQKLNPQKPVDVYWIRYTEGGQRKDLSAMQWRLAYGYKHRVSTTDSYEFRLNAFPEKALKIAYHRGKPVALTQISGQEACLQKVFVQLDPDAGLIPKVLYVEMFGVHADTGQPLYERIIP